MKKPLSLLLLPFLLFCDVADAQVSTDIEPPKKIELTDLEKSMLKSVHRARVESFTRKQLEKRKKFRLIKTVENPTQPEKFDEILHIASTPEGAVATVHNTKSGEPEHSCITPCKLRVRKSRKKSVLLYKEGYMPTWGPILRRWKGSPVYLRAAYSPNLKEKVRIANKCIEEFAEFPAATRPPFYKRKCKNPAPLLGSIWKKSSEKYLACNVTYDVHPGRWVENVRDVECTNTDMCFPTYKKVNDWVFYPWPYKTRKEHTIGKQGYLYLGNTEETAYMKANRDDMSFLPCFPVP